MADTEIKKAEPDFSSSSPEELKTAAYNLVVTGLLAPAFKAVCAPETRQKIGETLETSPLARGAFQEFVIQSHDGNPLTSLLSIPLIGMPQTGKTVNGFIAAVGSKLKTDEGFRTHIEALKDQGSPPQVVIDAEKGVLSVVCDNQGQIEELARQEIEKSDILAIRQELQGRSEEPLRSVPAIPLPGTDNKMQPVAF